MTVKKYSYNYNTTQTYNVGHNYEYDAKSIQKYLDTPTQKTNFS